MKQVEPDPPEQENQKGEKQKTGREQSPHQRVIPRRQGLELRLRPRRVKIKPEEKRHEYIRRIDKVIETLEAIINSEEADEKIRIQAANALARLVSTSYVMIVDIDIENIEEQAETLQKMIEDRQAKKGLVWDSEKKQWVPESEKPRE